MGQGRRVHRLHGQDLSALQRQLQRAALRHQSHIFIQVRHIAALPVLPPQLHRIVRAEETGEGLLHLFHGMAVHSGDLLPQQIRLALFRRGEVPVSIVPGEHHRVESHLVRHCVQGRLGVGVPYQGHQALEVQDKVHLAFRGQPALDLRLSDQEIRLRRVGEEVGVIPLQRLIQHVQVLLPGRRRGRRRLRRLDGGAGEQGGCQDQGPGPPERCGAQDDLSPQCIITVVQ